MNTARREKARTDPSSASAHAPASAEGTPVPQGAPDETGDEHEHDQEDSSVGPGPKPRGGAAKDAHPPSKRYRLTDKMKAIIWQLVCLSNECCRIENEKKCVCVFGCGCRVRIPSHLLSVL